MRSTANLVEHCVPGYTTHIGSCITQLVAPDLSLGLGSSVDAVPRVDDEVVAVLVDRQRDLGDVPVVDPQAVNLVALDPLAPPPQILADPSSEHFRVSSHVSTMTDKPVVVISLLGTKLDAGVGPKRWEKWRPTVSLGRHEDLLVTRLELLYQEPSQPIVDTVTNDLASVSPETEVAGHVVSLSDPWDFEEVFGVLHDFAASYEFDDDCDYLVHITTGTHVAQICLFLLTEARWIPGRLLQTAPPPRGHRGEAGRYDVIDLDLSRYDKLATRFAGVRDEAQSFLKQGIATRNAAFNKLIEQIEHVAEVSTDPVLLTGPTGAGKTHLARRIFALKRHRRQVTGSLVEVNCATLRGDGAMSALFGHVRGAFTGAQRDRPGLLRAADGGLLFLDEIGELGLDEQAMMLRAIESGTYLPVGSDREVKSSFQLIAGTNRDLWEQVKRGTFREDLLARINLWTFELPGLRDRIEDLSPNLDYELDRWAERTGQRVTFNTEAHRYLLRFAESPEARWSGNFRDLNAALTRMATLAPAGRITRDVVDDEILRLKRSWVHDDPARKSPIDTDVLMDLLGEDVFAELDRFDVVQLADVVAVCQQSRSLSAAGRTLFAVSRTRRKTVNDADRLRKYLARFDLTFEQIHDSV